MLPIRTKASFEIALRNISLRHDRYQVFNRGNRHIAIASGKELAVYHEGGGNQQMKHNKKIRTLLSVARSSATKYLNKHLENIPVIERMHPVLFIDRDAWYRLNVNEIFYLVDARACYWRIAMMLGYISKNIFEKYMDDELKTARNMALAVWTTSIRKDYYSKGVKTHEISCDISPYQIIYNNIRNFTYNHSGETRAALGKDFIAYRVDGVYCLPTGLTVAKASFRKAGLDYRVTKCVKIDEKNYVNSDGEIKKMI